MKKGLNFPFSFYTKFWYYNTNIIIDGDSQLAKKFELNIHEQSVALLITLRSI